MVTLDNDLFAETLDCSGGDVAAVRFVHASACTRQTAYTSDEEHEHEATDGESDVADDASDASSCGDEPDSAHGGSTVGRWSTA